MDKETREQEKIRETRWHNMWCRAADPNNGGEADNAYRMLVAAIQRDGFDCRDVRLTARDAVLNYERMQEIERRGSPPDPVLTARNTELETQVAELEARIKRLERSKSSRNPDQGTLTLAGRGNFSALMGDLVMAARRGGMAPAAIYQRLRAFQDFDAILTPNMIYGIRITGNPDDILPEGDQSPITRGEIMAMQQKLWGDENSVRPMERFIMSHVQRDIHGYMHDDKVLGDLSLKDCATLRSRFWTEIRLRESNPRYAAFSRGLALMEKRTTTMKRHTDTILTTDEVMALVTAWFVEDKRFAYVAQLCGYDHVTAEQALAPGRRLPEQLVQTVHNVRTILGNSDPADPNITTILAAGVKTWNKKNQRQLERANRAA